MKKFLNSGSQNQRSVKSVIVTAVSIFLAIGAGAFVVAQSTSLHSSLLPASPGKDITGTMHSYFTEERFAAFSGSEFNLYPSLIAFLDKMEDIGRNDVQMKPVIEDLVSKYLRFVNSDKVKFELYQIKYGDNFWKIAKQRGYTIDTIVGSNPHLENIICFSRQKILLPNRGGSLHEVANDETLSTIALEYGVDSSAIAESNIIDPKWDLIPGMWLFIPGAKPRHLSEKMHSQYQKRALFRSPLAGRYTSFVGKRIHPVTGFSKFHNGVDIACPNNTWVGASASGKVIAAGWGGAVGKYIKIDHQNGYQTVYGHLNQIYVKNGQTIKKGQLIGRSGATGRVTGPHLHYAIYNKSRVVDPMDFLW